MALSAPVPLRRGKVGMTSPDLYWRGRRGGRADAGYMCELQDAALGSVLRVGRKPLERFQESEIGIMALLPRPAGRYAIIRLTARAGPHLSTHLRRFGLTASVGTFPEGFDDPFSVAGTPGVSQSFRCDTMPGWADYLLCLDMQGAAGESLCLAIRTGAFEAPVARCGDHLDIAQVTATGADVPPLLAEVQDCPRDLLVISTPEIHMILSRDAPLVLMCGPVKVAPGRHAGVDLLAGAPLSRIHLNDSRSLWYRDGIEGGGGIAAVAALIVAARTTFQAPRFVAYGVSMGGYGALLFGALAGADAMMAFNAELQLLHTGSRSSSFIRDGVPHPWPDLLPLLAQTGTPMHLFYSRQDPIDQVFDRIARRISMAQIHRVDGAHNIGHYFEDYLWLLHAFDCLIADPAMPLPRAARPARSKPVEVVAAALP